MYFLTMNLTILSTPYKWNQTVCLHLMYIGMHFKGQLNLWMTHNLYIFLHSAFPLPCQCYLKSPPKLNPYHAWPSFLGTAPKTASLPRGFEGSWLR